MTGVVGVVGGASPPVAETAGAVASLLRADLRRVGPKEGLKAPAGARAVVDELAAPEILVAVVPDGAAMEAETGYLISTCRKPVVVTPHMLSTHHPLVISRVLLPLDGSWEAAAAVAPTAQLLSEAGVDLIVLHVFHAATVPRVWDQAAHERNVWEGEFLARYCPHPGVRLHLHTGAPGEHVIAVAAQERADLIALGWSQQLDPDRSATVRHSITQAHVPVMLMPVTPGRPSDDVETTGRAASPGPGGTTRS